MKLLVFAGSTRQNSWNRKLATVTAAMARASGAEVTHIELADFDVPMYNADLEARGTPADVMKLKQITYEHPAWIICTPEYNASYPALLKNTLDWISSPVKSDPVWNDDFRSTRGTVVGVLSASPGASARSPRDGKSAQTRSKFHAPGACETAPIARFSRTERLAKMRRVSGT